MPESALLARARELHRTCLVIDGHADTLDRVVSEGHAFLEGSPELQLDWPRLVGAGLNAQALALWTPPEYQGERAMARALKLLAAFFAMQRQADLPQVMAVGDLDPSRSAVVLTLEGADPLVEDPANLEVFYRLGVRMIGLTWNGRNAFADGQKVGSRPSGLTEKGRELVQRMSDLGVVLDLSHLAETGFWDAFEATEGPLAVSHANARAVHDHPRNLSDAQLKAIAERGGVVGVTFVPGFLCKGPADRSHVIAHLEYMLDRMGEDHVALGSDFDGITAGPAGLGDVSALPYLTADLLGRGHGEQRVAKILGGNWERVFRAVWK